MEDFINGFFINLNSFGLPVDLCQHRQGARVILPEAALINTKREYTLRVWFVGWEGGGALLLTTGTLPLGG